MVGTHLLLYLYARFPKPRQLRPRRQASAGFALGYILGGLVLAGLLITMLGNVMSSWLRTSNDMQTQAVTKQRMEQLAYALALYAQDNVGKDGTPEIAGAAPFGREQDAVDLDSPIYNRFSGPTTDAWGNAFRVFYRSSDSDDVEGAADIAVGLLSAGPNNRIETEDYQVYDNDAKPVGDDIWRRLSFTELQNIATTRRLLETTRNLAGACRAEQRLWYDKVADAFVCQDVVTQLNNINGSTLQGDFELLRGSGVGVMEITRLRPGHGVILSYDQQRYSQPPYSRRAALVVSLRDCEEGQILKWVGGSWNCATDNTNGSGASQLLPDCPADTTLLYDPSDTAGLYATEIGRWYCAPYRAPIGLTPAMVGHNLPGPLMDPTYWFEVKIISGAQGCYSVTNNQTKAAFAACARTPRQLDGDWLQFCDGQITRDSTNRFIGCKRDTGPVVVYCCRPITVE